MDAYNPQVLLRGLQITVKFLNFTFLQYDIQLMILCRIYNHYWSNNFLTSYLTL